MTSPAACGVVTLPPTVPRRRRAGAEVSDAASASARACRRTMRVRRQLIGGHQRADAQVRAEVADAFGLRDILDVHDLADEARHSWRAASATSTSVPPA